MKVVIDASNISPALTELRRSRLHTPMEMQCGTNLIH